jgi:hypothetical protein
MDRPEKKRKRPLIWIAAGLVVLVAAACALMFVTFQIDIGPGTPPPSVDGNLSRTQSLLDAARTHQGEPIPEDLPSDLVYGAEQCWEFLQTNLEESDDQYEITVTLYGEGGTATGHGAREAVVIVEFANGAQALLQYYNYHLDVCREADLD